jgi:hypothetical protein
VPAGWVLADGSRQIADATGAGQTVRLQTGMAFSHLALIEAAARIILAEHLREYTL